MHNSDTHNHTETNKLDNDFVQLSKHLNLGGLLKDLYVEDLG